LKNQTLDVFPDEIRMVIKALSHEIRQAIMIQLMKNGELSFSELHKRLNISKVKLNNHLKNLFSSGLIDHYYKHELGDPRYSYYSLSKLGKRIINNLIKSFIPPAPITEISPAEGKHKKYFFMYNMDTLVSITKPFKKSTTRKKIIARVQSNSYGEINEWEPIIPASKWHVWEEL